MLKRQYRILKYIYKNPEIKKSELMQKFSDFEKYEKSISEYVLVTDKNFDVESEIREKLSCEAMQKHMNNSEISEYINQNIPKDIQNTTNNSLIFFSANLKFQEELENRRRNAFLFWFPYSITTIIAIASLISQFIF